MPENVLDQSVLVAPLAIRLGGRVGFTLWAPPWLAPNPADRSQSALADGTSLQMFDHPQQIAYFVRSGASRLPSPDAGWAQVRRWYDQQFVPTPEFTFDFDTAAEASAAGAAATRAAELEIARTLYLAAVLFAACGDADSLRWLYSDPVLSAFAGGVPSAKTDRDDVRGAVHEHWPELVTRLARLMTWPASLVPTWEPRQARQVRLKAAPRSRFAVAALVLSILVPVYAVAGFKIAVAVTADVPGAAFYVVLGGLVLLALVCGHIAVIDTRRDRRRGRQLATVILAIWYGLAVGAIPIVLFDYTMYAAGG